MPGKQTKLAELTGARLRAFLQQLQEVQGSKVTIRTLAESLEVQEDRCGTWVSGKIELPPYYASLLRDLYGLNPEFMYSLDPDRLEPDYLPVKRLPTTSATPPPPQTQPYGSRREALTELEPALSRYEGPHLPRYGRS